MFFLARAKIIREYAEEKRKTKDTKTSGVELKEKLKQRHEGHKNLVVSEPLYYYLNQSFNF